MGEIRIYGDIGEGGITASWVVAELERLRAAGDAAPLTVRVHSPGGDVFDGMAIHAALMRWPGQKTIEIDGLAASIASVIAMAGDAIRMAPHSMMMIHEPWGGVVGRAEEMRSRAELLDQIAGQITDAYVRKTGLAPDKVRALMAAETWLGASEAVALGFADAVSATATRPESGVAASALARFARTPERAIALCCADATQPADPSAASSRATAGDPPAAAPEEDAPMADPTTASAQHDEMLAAVRSLQTQIHELRDRPAAGPVSALVADAVSRAAPAPSAAPVIARFASPRALAHREERSDEMARSDRERRALPLARVACATVVAKEFGATVPEACEYLGFRATAERIAQASAMSAGDATAGGSFVPTEIMTGYIDMLDEVPGSIMALIPAANRYRSTQPSIQLPTITGGAQGGWVAENPSAGNPESLATGTKTLTAKKQRVEVVISRELLRGASNVDQIVLAKMLQRSQQLDELAFVEGTGANGQPRGLETIVTSGHSVAMTSNPDYDKIRGDLLALLKKLAIAKVPAAAGRAFILPEQAKWGLLGEANTAGSDYPYERELLAGRLLGHPVGLSSLIGTDKVYCFAPGEAIAFEQLAMSLENDNVYSDSSGTAKVASGADQTVIRLWRKVDYDLMHDLAVAVKTGITWGA